MAKKDKSTENSLKKQQASDFLKTADKYFKAGELKEAAEEVEKALECDPGNFYARAYKDRINAARAAGRERTTTPQEGDQSAELFKKKLQQEHQRAEGEKNRQEADRLRAEQELRRRASELEAVGQREQEEHRRTLEQRRQEEGELRRSEEEKRRKMEEELTRKREEEEQKRKAEGERKHKADEERKRIETEERRKTDETRKKLEEEIRRRLEEERARKQEEEYLRKASEEGRRQAVSHKIEEYITNAGQYLQEHNYDNAILEAMRIITLDPENSYARQIEELVKSAWSQAHDDQVSALKSLPHELYVEAYKHLLTLAWREGTWDETLTTVLEDVRTKLNISFDEYIQLERVTQVDAYTAAVRKALEDGTLTPEEGDHLQLLRKDLNISADDHLNIEQSIRKELGY